MEQLVQFILNKITLHPENIAVNIEEADEGKRLDLELCVDPEDIGIIIGKHGKTINAIRNLINVLAYPGGIFVQLNVKEKEN